MRYRENRKSRKGPEKRKFPMANHYLVYSKNEDGTYLAEDISTRESWTLDADTARFLCRLNGHTPPSRICPELTAGERRELLCELKREGLIREKKRIYCNGLFTVMCALWIPGRKTSRKLAVGVNRLVFLFSMPVLAGGRLFYLNHYSEASASVYASGEMILFGMLLGLVTGMLLHETAHAAAGIAYGAHVCELGLMLYFLFPGAYVILDAENVKSRGRRIQIYGAGVEANFMLTGIFLFFAALARPFFWLFSQAALTNICLAVCNLSLIFGLDGMKIFSEVTGTPDPVQAALQILGTGGWQGKLPRQEMSRYAAVTAAVIIVAFQIAFFCMILTNLAVLTNLRWGWIG